MSTRVTEDPTLTQDQALAPDDRARREMSAHPQAALAEAFGRSREHLRAVAYRMLGSVDEAEDAVQEAWLRASRADLTQVRNLPGWLTTIVSRICLDLLRARQRRREHLTDATTFDQAPGRASGHGPEWGPGLESGPGPAAPVGPEDEAVLAESVGLALLVVMDRLGPAERVAYVLHDLFAVPFHQLAEVVDRSPDAAKKLASRARARVRGGSAGPTEVRVAAADLARQRRVVEAFLAASRAGDLAGLLAVLAPEVVRRADPVALAIAASAGAGRPTGPAEVRGAGPVARETLTNSGLAGAARSILVDGTPGVVVAPCGRLRLALVLTVEDERITGIEVVADPDRLRRLSLAVPPPLP